MYNGVNDENNESSFNSDENLYHYSYSKDQAPQPGQPDPSQTSWQPAPRPEPQAAQEDQTSCPTGDYQDEPRIPKTNGKSFWKKTGTKVTALVLCCALVGGLCGFGGASLARKTGKTAIQETGRTASAVSVKSVDGQTLMTPAEVYASTVNSVVSINCSAVSTNIFGQKVESASSGSGFVITQDGYIVTNQHVVSGASSVNVTLYNGDTYPATVVGGDSDYDVAVLKIEATGLQAVTLGKSADVNVGDTVMAIGNPLGELTYSLTDGLISALDRLITTGSGNDSTTMNMLQTNCAINPGNSGGPLFNSYGEVIGITTAKYSTSSSGTNVEGLGFAIPINDVKNIISDLIQYGYVTGKPYMGITGVTMSASVAQQYGVTNAVLGVYVATVEDGSCSAKAGLQPGDIITAMDEDDVVTFQDLEAAKATHQAGDTVTLTVFRNGEKLELSLTLDEQPRETVTDTSSQQQQQPQQNNQYYGWPFGGFFS